MSEISPLNALFAAKGFELAELPILQEAQAFLDFSGEDIRRRLFLTQGAGGQDYCLRPDFTIPVSKHFLASGKASAAFCYNGPVFRQRSDGAPEFMQAGVEMFGHTDAEAAEAELIGFAQQAVGLYGVSKPALNLGDSAVLKSVLKALSVPEAMARRIRLAMGKGEAALQKALSSQATDTAYGGMVGALAGRSAEEAKAMVEEVLNLAGIAPIGGRPVAHIAERFLAQAEMAKGLPAKTQDTLASYFEIAAPLPKAIEALEKLSSLAGLDLNGRMASFRRRAELMAAQNIAVDDVQFSTRFGRRMDYYTGMVFEIYNPANTGAGHVVGGGRYDGLLTALGASGRVPAVGCSIWLDRLQGTGK